MQPAAESSANRHHATVHTSLTEGGSANPPTSCAPCSYRDRLEALFTVYAPHNVGQVDAVLFKYKGKEEAVIQILVKKYGPEPSSTAVMAAADGNPVQRSKRTKCVVM
jgi:hypothetical protein